MKPTKIKMFKAIDMDILEKDVNAFMKDKEVLTVNVSSIDLPSGNFRAFAEVLYKDRRKCIVESLLDYIFK